MWDPRPPSKHASPLPEPPVCTPLLRPVTTATPAKRITFYRSGDSQFGGVRMAIHKRSFKCFDALLDDLSQKVPLPFGVRTITTPRGTNAITRLEQLQDGGCYLCSDRRQTKPIDMELANKHPNVWCRHTRRPQPPQPTPTKPAGGRPTHRQRRLLLVKNGEPGMRRSVVLNRRSTRSLRAFLDEVSEVMQFHVRKLYTAEGRKIDSVQSLLTCPGVLVCVGREAFSPTLVNFIKKNSEEKLPGLGSRSPGLGPRTPGNGVRSPATPGTRSPPHGAQSRTSEYSDGHESKKSVNFGLETKKSIIHPRSDSSNRSTRFSLSSDKSYAHVMGARPAIANDDIEKRVLVNKDGSLSVEMRVRFRLHSDETLHWSTRIKKSPSLMSDCWPPGRVHVQPCYLQTGQSGSCSDPDTVSLEPEGVVSNHRTLETNSCSCCDQRHEQPYDLWENPAHINKRPPRTSCRTHTVTRHTNSSSSSASCHSVRLIRETRVTEQVEAEQDGGVQRVEVCSVSRCCSRSEVVSRDSDLRPLSRKSVTEEEEEEERRLSSLSSSSHVLQSLKEDRDDEDDELPPSPSLCCHSNKPSPSPASQTHTQGDEEKRATSRTSARSFMSNKSEKPVTSLSSKAEETRDNEQEMVEEETQQSGEDVARAASIKSCRSATSGDAGDGLSCKSNKETDVGDMVDRAHTAMSGTSHMSSEHALGQKLSPRRTRASPKSPQCLRPGPCGGGTRASSVLSVHSTASAKSGTSKCGCGVDSARGKRRKGEIVMNKEDEEEVRSEEAASILSSSSSGQRSRRSSGSVSLVVPEDRETTVSFHTNTESKGRVTTANPDETSAVKDDVEGKGSKVDEKPPSADLPTIETPGDKQKRERAASACSVKSSSSHRCSCGVKASAQTPESQRHGGDRQTGSGLQTKQQRTRASSSSPLSSTSAEVQNHRPASVRSPVSPHCIRPESVASAKSGSKVKSTGGGSVKPDCLHPDKAHEAEREAGSDDVGDGGGVELSGPEKKETHIKPSDARPSHCCSGSRSSLSHSLSAANLLQDTTGTRPHSRQSESRTESERSAGYQRGRDEKDKQELTPACLPNASPNEVVSNWLRSIPADGGVLALGDELEEGQQGKEEVETSGGDTAREGTGPEAGAAGQEETPEPDVDGEAKCDAPQQQEEEEEQSPDPGDVSRNLLSRDESLPRNCQSAAAVMKVLLKSSMGRCRSLPEVSPAYGRRLSTSARDLLDRLAQLQLIAPVADHNQQREDIMVILQSLWKPEPRDLEAQQAKDVGTEQVTPPRSSSGVGMSSGSAGSGKENGHQHNMESLQGCDGAEKVETEAEGGATEKTLGEEQSLESLKANENPSSSDKSSPHHSKSPTDNEQETVEDSSSGTPPTLQRATMSQKPSQDPDPLWVLQLLKKMEKQFISHYVTAMAEFKVRWDLDDSLILDTMISELRDEVSRRVQGSVEREIRKIQGRAGGGGRSPRPPRGANLSRESTMTEKRRRMLKVMKNQSVRTADSLSDGELTGELSDQRSDDEYCPCDACVRKKMAARPLKTNTAAAQAPVMMEFDLVKILQQKKSPTQTTAAAESDRQVSEEETRNLEVVQEEEEEEQETKEDVKAKVVMEEVIPEEEEEEDKNNNIQTADDEGGDEEEKESEGSDSKPEEEKETDSSETSAVVVEGNISSTAEDEEGGSQEERQGGESCEQEKASSQEGEGPGGSGPDEAGGAEEEVSSSNKEDVALLHQLTRTSVESQPGSLEDTSTASPQVQAAGGGN